MQFVGTSLLYIMVNIFLNPRQNISTNKEMTASSLVDLARHYQRSFPDIARKVIWVFTYYENPT